jgi:hypothetical protein
MVYGVVGVTSKSSPAATRGPNVPPTMTPPFVIRSLTALLDFTWTLACVAARISTWAVRVDPLTPRAGPWIVTRALEASAPFDVGVDPQTSIEAEAEPGELDRNPGRARCDERQLVSVTAASAIAAHPRQPHPIGMYLRCTKSAAGFPRTGHDFGIGPKLNPAAPSATRAISRTRDTHRADAPFAREIWYGHPPKRRRQPVFAGPPLPVAR